MTPDFLIKELNKNDISAERSTQTLDGQKIPGITIGGPNSGLFYRESFLMDMPQGQVQSLIEAIKVLLPEELSINTANAQSREPEPDMLSWEYAKDNVYLCPQEENYYLTNVCKKKHLDLDIYLRVDTTPYTDGNKSSYVVRNDLFEKWGITEEELFEAATANSKTDFIIKDSLEEFKRREAELRKMGVLKSEINTLRKHEEQNREITVTCKSGYSAAIVVFDNVLEEIADTLKNIYAQDYMFCFTCDNTVVICPTDEDMLLSELADFTRKIHADESLPSHPYFYGAQKGLLFENLHEYIKYLEELGIDRDELEGQYDIELENEKYEE